MKTIVAASMAFAAVIVGAGNALASAEATSRGFRFPSLYHVGFRVRDLSKSRAFHKDFPGYEEPCELRRPNGDLQLVVM